MEVIVMGTEFHFEMIKNSGNESGDGCTILWMYLIPLYHTFKITKMLHFVIYILPLRMFLKKWLRGGVSTLPVEKPANLLSSLVLSVIIFNKRGWLDASGSVVQCCHGNHNKQLLGRQGFTIRSTGLSLLASFPFPPFFKLPHRELKVSLESCALLCASHYHPSLGSSVFQTSHALVCSQPVAHVLPSIWNTSASSCPLIPFPPLSSSFTFKFFRTQLKCPFFQEAFLS